MPAWNWQAYDLAETADRRAVFGTIRRAFNMVRNEFLKRCETLCADAAADTELVQSERDLVTARIQVLRSAPSADAAEIEELEGEGRRLRARHLALIAAQAALKSLAFIEAANLMDRAIIAFIDGRYAHLSRVAPDDQIKREALQRLDAEATAHTRRIDQRAPEIARLLDSLRAITPDPSLFTPRVLYITFLTENSSAGHR